MKRVKCALLIFVFSTLSLLGGCGFFGEDQLNYVSKLDYVFSDSGIVLEVMAPKGKDLNAAFDAIVKELKEIDKQTNINREGGSDVLSINLAAANQPVEIGFYTYKMIEMAKEMYKTSQGAFNIAAYPLAYLWGIDALAFKDFRSGLPYAEWRTPSSFAASDIVRTLPLPDAEEIERVKQLCDLDNLTISNGGEKYFATKAIGALMIDLGAISKGYSADLAAKIIRDKGIKSAKVDISGNLIFVGKYHNSKAWPVGIGNSKGDTFAAFESPKDSTVVTSGDYERLRVVGGGTSESLRITHIINVSTGLPYGIQRVGTRYEDNQSRVVNATVIANNSALSDCLSTAACVMGLEDAVRFLDSQGVQAVLTTADMRYAVVGGVSFIETNIYDNFKDYNYVEFD